MEETGRGRLFGKRPEGWAAGEQERRDRRDYGAEHLGAKPEAPPEASKPEAQTSAAAPEGDPELEPDAIEQLLFPKIYQPVRVVRAHGEAEAIFVPASGMPFSRAYAYKSGNDPLPTDDGFSFTYAGEVVEIRGERLLKVFWELAGHRAHVVRAWRGDWADRPRTGAVIKSITVKPVDVSEDSEAVAG